MINLTGSEIQTNTYYAVQFGIIATIAYYTTDKNWMILGFEDTDNDLTGEDFIVYSKVITHRELLDL